MYLHKTLSVVFPYPLFPIALGEPFKRSEERGMVGDHQVDLLLHRLGQDRLGQVVGQQDFFHLTLSLCNGNVFAHQPPWSLRARSATRHYPRTQQGRWGPSLPTGTPPGFPQVPIIPHSRCFLVHLLVLLLIHLLVQQDVTLLTFFKSIPPMECDCLNCLVLRAKCLL